MKRYPSLSRLPLSVHSVVCLLAIGPTLVRAQTAPPAATATPEPVVLSPFSVNSSQDRGYLAGSSLAGSRLATNLKNLAAPTTAFTEEFLRDVAVTDTTELAQFMLSTEHNFGELGGQQNSVLSDDAQTLRVRGLPGGRTAVNFFFADMRFDMFSMTRVDQSRGPNSILFGIGEPGGLINVSTKQALLGNARGEAGATVRSWNGRRVDLDYNQPLISKTLALRVAAVDNRKDSWRHWEYDRSRRYFGTAKWQVAPAVQINVEGETGEVDKSTKRTYTAHDGYTEWLRAGKAVSDTANAARGIRSMGATNFTVFDSTSGSLMNWRNKTASVRSVAPDGLPLAISDFSLLPRETVVYGPGYRQLNDYERLSAALSATVGEGLNLELSAIRLRQHLRNYDAIANVSFYLNADTSATLPDGRPNPNAGRPYLEAQPVLIEDHRKDDVVRLSFAYDRDLGRWGRHKLAGVAIRSLSELDRFRTVPSIVGNPFNTASPENPNNRISYRTYVDLAGPVERIVMPDPFRVDLNGRSVAGATGFSRDRIEVGMVPLTGSQIQTNKTTSLIALIQSAFFKNRLHTVLGYSRDDQDGYFSTLERGAPFAGFATGAYYVKRGTAPETFKADNVALSGVFHVNRWLSLTYNQTDNSSLPNRVGFLESPTGRPPVPKGRSRDYGLKFDLLDRRVYLTATYFQTAAEKNVSFTGVRGGDINPIWSSLNEAGVLAANGKTLDRVQTQTTVNTYDVDSKGVELELIANLTENWRLFANFSTAEVVQTNIGREMRDYIAANLPFWSANGRVPFVGTVGSVQTVADYLRVLEQMVVTEFDLPDGELLRGQAKQRGSLRTTYRFETGRLAGLSVGGGLRYEGKAVIAFSSTIDPVTRQLVKTGTYRDAQVLADLNFSYRLKGAVLGRKTNWTFQLNVNNALGKDDLVPLVIAPGGRYVSYRFPTPREFIFSTRMTF